MVPMLNVLVIAAMTIAMFPVLEAMRRVEAKIDAHIEHLRQYQEKLEALTERLERLAPEGHLGEPRVTWPRRPPPLPS